MAGRAGNLRPSRASIGAEQFQGFLGLCGVKAAETSMNCALAVVAPVSRSQVVVFVIGSKSARLSVDCLVVIFLIIFIQIANWDTGRAPSRATGRMMAVVVARKNLVSDVNGLVPLFNLDQFVDREFSAWGRQVVVRVGCLPIGAILAPLGGNSQSANHHLESAPFEYSPFSCCASRPC